MQSLSLFIVIACFLTGCAPDTRRASIESHLNAHDQTPEARGTPPRPVSLSIPRLPSKHLPQATYSLSVIHVPVHELLFALARDAQLDLDIEEGISGLITLNAREQPLEVILDRICRQANLRHEIRGRQLSIGPDTPFLRHYSINYINLARTTSATISTNTQISNSSPSLASSGSGALGAGGNISNTRIENNSRHQFWENLEKNVRDLLRESDKPLPEGSSETIIEQQANQNASALQAWPPGKSRNNAGHAVQPPLPQTQTSSFQSSGNALVRRQNFREAAMVISNPESGLLSVRASTRQHERIREFIDLVSQAARRQVLLEATIVEVELSDGYRQGIEWSRFRADGSGFSVAAPGLSGGLSDSANLVLKRLSQPLNLVAALNFLESFGTTKVLSSPRLSVLNNQTAMLKVVENYVYFNVKADTTTTANVGTTTTYTTSPQTVSVGLVVGLTPQISAQGEITLNIRPTITSIAREVRDPNPSLTIENRVPVIRTREIESVMRIGSGDIAILGGLMEDQVSFDTHRVPLLGSIPAAGELLTRRENSSRKAELVVFLRPKVITEPLLEAAEHGTVPKLPGQKFFTHSGLGEKDLIRSLP